MNKEYLQAESFDKGIWLGRAKELIHTFEMEMAEYEIELWDELPQDRDWNCYLGWDQLEYPRYLLLLNPGKLFKFHFYSELAQMEHQYSDYTKKVEYPTIQSHYSKWDVVTFDLSSARWMYDIMGEKEHAARYTQMAYPGYYEYTGGPLYYGTIEEEHDIYI